MSSKQPRAPRALACIVMAGGKGTRMRSALPKVLHPVCGRPILGWVLAAARGAGASRLCVVIPPEADGIRAMVDGGIEVAVQPIANGTGDAVLRGLDAIRDHDGDVLVVSGDTPLIQADLLADLIAVHQGARAAATLLTVDVAPPHAYGRIVRDRDGSFERIVEARDASPRELRLTEINAGFYVADAARLRGALERVGTDNDQGELYLTDAIGLLRADGAHVRAHRIAGADSLHGVNDRLDLAEAERLLRHRLLEAHMLAGVGIVDPASTFIDVDVILEPDCRIEPFTVLRGTTRVARGATVGPHAVLADTDIGEGAIAGPFCYLRPGTVLQAGARVGSYVEIKNSVVGEGSKIPHLSYIGDAEIGVDSNIGAGTITANYDGVRKHRTVIGDRARISSNNVLVAPVTVGDDATTGAGSVITENVPEGALGIARARQVNIEGYAERQKGG